MAATREAGAPVSILGPAKSRRAKNGHERRRVAGKDRARRSPSSTPSAKTTRSSAADRKPYTVAKALLRWSAAGHRRDFVWRNWKNRYRLLVAEVLLRQTRAETVAALIPTFLAKYPTPKRLSLAPEPEIVRVIRPLGFGRQRGAQLRALAARLVQHPFPHRLDQLRGLPGIGRYSAGMVAAAMGTKAAAVDTNVARVVCRVFGIEPSHAEARKSRNVWETAQEVVASASAPAEITWAMLDLAAVICGERRPRCYECPLAQSCVYRAASLRGEPRVGASARG